MTTAVEHADAIWQRAVVNVLHVLPGHEKDEDQQESKDQMSFLHAVFD